MALGPNTNVDRDLLNADCVLLIGEDPELAEPLLGDIFGRPCLVHSFRGFVFQKRRDITTVFSGMGSGCVQSLIWEMARSDVQRLILLGTAGRMPACELAYAQPVVIAAARAAASAFDAIGLSETYRPRWKGAVTLPYASAVSTDFYYGFGDAILSADHPLAATALRRLYIESREQLVDMEVAPFYAMCALCMPTHVQYIAIKSPSNPAGNETGHLANTPAGLDACGRAAADMLSGRPVMQRDF